MNNDYETKVVRKRITVYGSVQGVGFRYRAKHAAEALGATGWVRNEDDGTVTMEIQGTEQQIDRVLQTIEKGTFVRMEQIKARSLPIEEGEYHFQIRESSEFFGFWHSK